METNLTAMQELLINLKNMGDTIPLETNDTTLIALISAIESKYLDKEQRQIIESFNAGEMNVWNSKRDEGFEYEGGSDFYRKYYAITNNLINE